MFFKICKHFNASLSATAYRQSNVVKDKNWGWFLYCLKSLVIQAINQNAISPEKNKLNETYFIIPKHLELIYIFMNLAQVIHTDLPH